MKFSDAEYIECDPFDGDRDVALRCRTIKMVTTRKPQQCHDPNKGRLHTIPAGTRARYETALVDGEWGKFYVCVECMDKWFIEYCGRKPE